MNRRRDDLQNLDTSTWPTVDSSALAAAKRKAFEERQDAINLYTSGQTLREIERRTGINSSQLYGLLDRCLALADDGRVFGFRGLLKHHRIGTYARTAKISAGYSGSGKGLAGALPAGAYRNCPARCDVMETPGLPIMVFDERTLTPSLGYVFDKRWLDLFESIVSILWKLGRMNRLPGQLITMQLAKSAVDPYEGVSPCVAEVDLHHLHRALGLPLKLVRNSLLPEGLQAAAGLHFRYCSKCLCRGYHSIVHQIGFTKSCPVHGDPLEVAC